MAKFLRHIGRHGDRKVAVVFREVPGEPHMCLVVYTEILNQHMHDPMMKCIESDIGQTSENLADALNRSYSKDGKPILQVLHAEGQLKKVNTELILMTPMPNTKIKLSELNKLLNEMQQGEEAVKKLSEMDQSRGMQTPSEVARRMRGDKLPEQMTQNTATAPSAAQNNALNDNQIANNLRQQAQRMANEAKGLLQESERLLKEAASMDGITVQPESTAIPSVSNQPVAKPKRGRPAKVKVTA